MFSTGSTGRSVASAIAMLYLRPLCLWLLLAAVPATASAVTIDQLVALKKAGVTDVVVLALIERDHTVFTLQPEQIVALQRDGLSEDVIIAMLKSGQAGDEAARAESAYASAMVAAAIAPGPDVLIVGHGPERPNTYHGDGFFTNGAPAYAIPPFSVFPSRGYRRRAPYGYNDAPIGVKPHVRGDALPQSTALCYAQVASGPSRSNTLSFVTECPRVLQPRRLR
jgi:hypothetical protein